jgi:hypothetical protein
MKRKPLAFKQRDVTRAIRALQTSGVKCGRIEIKPDGTITLFIGDQPPSKEDTTKLIEDFIAEHAGESAAAKKRRDEAELDRELAEFRASHGYK